MATEKIENLTGFVLEIGGVPLDCRTFRWGLVSGVSSPEYSFIVHNSIAEKLRKIVNPTYLKIDAKGYTGNKTIEIKRRFEDLYLWNVRECSASETEFTLRDIRAHWENVRVTAEFNRIRLNDTARVPSYAIGSAADFQRMASLRYYSRSLKDSNNLQHASATVAAGSAQAQAWTALEIVRWLLTEVLPDECEPDQLVIEAKDIKFIPEDSNHLEDRFPEVLAHYLNLARANLYIDGKKCVIYNLADIPPIKNIGGYDGAGWPAMSDFSRWRPKKAVYRFPIEWEVRLDYVESSAGPNAASIEGHELYLENVLRNPNKVACPDGGEYQVGEWITVQQALAAWEKDSAHPWPSTRPLTFENLRKDYLLPAIMDLYCWAEGTDYPDFVDPVKVARIDAVLKHYRKTFRICEVWRTAISSWRPSRVQLWDAMTQNRQPSPVYMDHTVIPKLTPVTVRNKNAPTVRRIRVWPKGNTTRLLSEASVTIEAVLDVIRPVEYGIFTVNIYPDLEGHRQAIIPGIVDNPPNYDIFLLTGGITFDDEADGTPAQLEPDWCFSTLLSMTLATPQDKRHHEIVKPADSFTKEAALGSYFYSFKPQEPLRVQWDDATSKTSVDTKQGLKITGGKQLNPSQLDAIASVDAERLYFSLRDRIIGEFKSPYWIDNICRPSGNLRAVILDVNGDEGSAESLFVIPEPPPPMDSYELLPKEVRKILYPRIEAGGQS